MSNILSRRDDELSNITGGGGVVSMVEDLAGGINGALGRTGKPFFGRDFVAVAAGVGVGLASGNPLHGLSAGKAVDIAYDMDRKTGLAGGASHKRPGKHR